MLRRMSLTMRPAGGVLLACGVAAFVGTATTILAGQPPAGRTSRAAMYTDAQAAAGESVYRQSCAGCHRQELAFTDGRATALGSTGQAHPRSAMSLANVAYALTLTWANPLQVDLEHGRAARPELHLGVCGEHGGDPDSIHFFDDVGLDYVSCSPFRVPVARLEAGRSAAVGDSDTR